MLVFDPHECYNRLYYPKSGIEKGNWNDVGFDVDSEGLKHTQELSDR